MANTERLNILRTEKMFAGRDVPGNAARLILTPITFEDSGYIYEISPNLIGLGGESQVYHAKEKYTGWECSAKVDTSGLIYNAVARENRRLVVEFLRSHNDFHKNHILPLLASGTIQIKGHDGTVLPYPVDIFPFCSGGDLEKSLKKYSFDQLKKNIIPALCAALNTIHENNIIHRDIKPANIFEFDGEIVVSDFGTAVVVEGSDDGVAHSTELARRTLGYSAPEINSRYAKKASDYFSMGCTLATLYNGKHPYAHVLAGGSDFAFYQLINEQGIEMPYQKGDEALKYLIDALVREKLSERIGYNEIMLWLEDSGSFIKQYGTPAGSGSTTRSGKWKDPFNFEDEAFWNENDLAVAMASKWQEAKRYLYRGQVMNFFRWDQTLQNRIDLIVNNEPTAQNDDLGLAYFLHFLLRGGKIYWCGNEYKALSDIATHIYEGVKAEKPIDSNIIKMLQSKYLSWKWTENIQSSGVSSSDKAALINDLEGIRSIETIALSHPQLAYYYAMYQWGKNIKPQIESVDAFFASLSRTPGHFYENIDSLIHDDHIWASISELGFIDQVLHLKERFGSNTRENINLIYDTFESICSDKKTVRAHFIRYGPDSYLYWLKNNLSLYTFNSGEAKEIKRKIENVSFSDSMPMNDIKESFSNLRNHFSANGDFQNLFQSDFLIASLGLTKGKGRHGEITATHVDAFFLDSFLGNEVPVGFKKYLGFVDEINTLNHKV